MMYPAESMSTPMNPEPDLLVLESSAVETLQWLPVNNGEPRLE